MPCPLLSAHLRCLFQTLQVCSGRVLYQSLKFGCLGVSAGNVCGELGPDIMVYGGGLTAVQALKMGVGIVAGAENSWIGLLTGFPTRVSLENVLPHCLDSLVELTRWLGLCTVFSSKWGYELASLSQQDSRMGFRASTALFGDLNQLKVCTGFPGQVRTVCRARGRPRVCSLFSATVSRAIE